MYESFYGLKEKPFSIQPDPEFLYLCKRHGIAYAMLEYGVENHAAFSVLCGEIGSGKTTLIRHLMTQLGPEYSIGIVYNTSELVEDLMAWVMLAYDLSYDKMSDVKLFDQFQQFLIKNYAEGKRTVLIVDEAQNLQPLVLESLRMLTNINADKEQLLQIILVGQPQLRELLNRPGLEQIAQRVSVDYFIPPLESSDIRQYIEHRLLIAGRSRPLFTQAAYERIAEASGGIPRSINKLCDTSLVYGFSGGAEMIDVELVDEVIHDKKRYGIF